MHVATVYHTAWILFSAHWTCSSYYTVALQTQCLTFARQYALGFPHDAARISLFIVLGKKSSPE